MHERFHFGKHKGRLVSDVPSSYLAWCLRELSLSPWLRRAIEDEIEKREGEYQARQQDRHDDVDQGAIIEAKLVRVWYGTMAREFHPDRGGSDDAMRAVNRGRELLLQLVEVN